MQLQVFRFHGATRDSAFKAAEEGRAEVLLTTYDTLRREAARLANLEIHVSV